jgi:serine/threonine protein phosphatase 1
MRKSDKLIILGDLIDRGFDSKGVLDTVLLLIESGFDVTCLKGNHEAMFLDAIKSEENLGAWLMNGGGNTLSSFLTSSIHKIPMSYIKFINSFKYYHEYENFIFVHAALNMQIKNPYEDIQTMLWSREAEKYIREDWLGDRILVHGHNPTSQEAILQSISLNKKIICIDNGSFLTKPNFGAIGILQLETMNINFIK